MELSGTLLAKITGVIDQRRRKWSWYVARMGNMSVAHRFGLKTWTLGNNWESMQMGGQ